MRSMALLPVHAGTGWSVPILTGTAEELEAEGVPTGRPTTHQSRQNDSDSGPWKPVWRHVDDRAPGFVPSSAGPSGATMIIVACLRVARVGLVFVLASLACRAVRGERGIDCDFHRPGLVAQMANHPLASLRRTGCFGRCPEYSVAIDVDGTIEYVGRENVMTLGRASRQLSSDALGRLRAAVLAAKQATLPREQCACGCVHDSDDAEVTTWEAGRPRTFYFEPDCERAPPELRALAGEIDHAVEIERWIGTRAEREACFVERRDCSSMTGGHVL